MLMNFFNKSEEDGPPSPPVKGPWEKTFDKELKEAVKLNKLRQQKKLNKKLEEDISSRKISSESTCSVDSKVSLVSSNYSQGCSPSKYHTPLQSPQQVYPAPPQFTFSTPKTSTSSLTPPNVSPPFEMIPEKTQINSSTSSSSERHKNNTAPSEPNLRVENDSTSGKRDSLALDKRVKVSALVSKFMQGEEDLSKSLRKRSTTVSTSQTDINSSKIPF